MIVGDDRHRPVQSGDFGFVQQSLVHAGIEDDDIGFLNGLQTGQRQPQRTAQSNPDENHIAGDDPGRMAAGRQDGRITIGKRQC